MASIKVKYQDKQQVFEVENKPVVLKYLMYLFEQKMNIPYYEEIDFSIDGELVFSGKKSELDSFVAFKLDNNRNYELRYL